MPVTITRADSGTDTTAAQTSKTTASITASANDLIVLNCFYHRVISTITVSGTGLTFTKKGEWNGAGDWRGGSTLYALVPGGGFSGTLTINAGGSSWDWILYEVHVIAGQNSGGSNGSSAFVQEKKITDSNAAVLVRTITYDAAWASDSAGLAVFAAGGGGYRSSPRSGWTEDNELNLAGASSLAVHVRTGSTDTAAAADYTIDGTPSAQYGVAYEIAAAAATSGQPTTRRFGLTEIGREGVSFRPTVGRAGELTMRRAA